MTEKPTFSFEELFLEALHYGYLRGRQILLIYNKNAEPPELDLFQTAAGIASDYFQKNIPALYNGQMRYHVTPLNGESAKMPGYRIDLRQIAVTETDNLQQRVLAALERKYNPPKNEYPTMASKTRFWLEPGEKKN